MDAVAPDISRSVGACVSQFTRNQILFFLYQTDFVSRLLRSGRLNGTVRLATYGRPCLSRCRICRMACHWRSCVSACLPPCCSAGAHELLPSIAAHPDSLRHTFRVVRAEGWIDREEHTDDAS
jgi:hypothetical protein